MDGHLVEEGRGDIEAVGDIVEVALGGRQVLGGGHDGVVGAAHSLASLEERVDHLATTRDVLLR